MEIGAENSKDSRSHALGFLCPRVQGKVRYRYVKGDQVEAFLEFEEKEFVSGRV